MRISDWSSDVCSSDLVLRGIPFAVKDVIDTSDYPTQYGSPIYKGFQPTLDAACVAMAKSRSAVMLGKVATGEFATQTPSHARSEEHTSELQSLMRISYAVFCLTKKNKKNRNNNNTIHNSLNHNY